MGMEASSSAVTFTYLHIRSSEKTATSRSLSGVERELRKFAYPGRRFEGMWHLGWYFHTGGQINMI